MRYQVSNRTDIDEKLLITILLEPPSKSHTHPGGAGRLLPSLELLRVCRP